jgi:hypothetical protein
MFVFIRKGVPIEPTRVLDPTVFSTPEQVGAAMFRRYYPEFSEGHVFIFASFVSFQNYDRVWKGLLALAREKKWNADAVFSQEGLRNISTDATETSFREYEKIIAAAKPADRVVLQLIANGEELQNMRKRFPQAVIIAEEPYPEKKFKKLNRVKLTAAAEFDTSQITHLYLYEPH